MRLFTLVRTEDETGISGTGVVAEGIEFSDGVVALRWIVPPDSPAAGNPTSVVFHDNGIASVEKIHGHDGKTRIVFGNPDEAQSAWDHAMSMDELRATFARDSKPPWIPAPDTDTGTGHHIQPRYVDGVLHGVAVYHDCQDGLRTYHWAPINRFPHQTDGWDLVSEDPLHIEPSLLCSACGDHGFVRDGTWIPT